MEHGLPRLDVLAGVQRHRGERAGTGRPRFRVLEIEARPREKRVIIENLNVVKRHRRPRPIRDSGRMGTPQILPGGVFEIAAPVPVSNVMLVCPACNQLTRVGYAFKEGQAGTIKVRVCKRPGCGQEVDR